MQGAQAYTGEKSAKDAKVILPAAEAIALKAHPARSPIASWSATAAVTGLRYSFDISNQGVVYEVGVDAKTGRVLENAPEGDHPA